MNRCDFEPDHGLAGPIARIPDQGLSHTCASVRVSLPQIWAASTTTRVLRRARRHQAAHQEHTRATKYKTTPEALVGGAATAPAQTAASTRWATTAMAAGAWRASAGRRGSATGEAGRGVGARSRAEDQTWCCGFRTVTPPHGSTRRRPRCTASKCLGCPRQRAGASRVTP